MYTPTIPLNKCDSISATVWVLQTHTKPNMPVAATLSHTHHTPEQITLRQKHIMQAEKHQNRLPAVEVQMRFLYLSYLLVNPIGNVIIGELH